MMLDADDRAALRDTFGYLIMVCVVFGVVIPWIAVLLAVSLRLFRLVAGV